MPLTRDFRETVKRRAADDPEFRKGLLREAMQSLLDGEADVTKLLLRNYINATVGFEEIGKAVDKSPKSLMRMFSDEGNPSLNNLMAVTRYLNDDDFSMTVVSESTPKRQNKTTSKKRVSRKRQTT